MNYILDSCALIIRLRILAQSMLELEAIRREKRMLGYD